MKRIFPLPLLLLLCMISCDRLDITGLFIASSPSPNERFAVSDSYNNRNGFKEISVPENEYSFYVSTDAHLVTTADGLTCFVNACLSDGNAAPFALFLGDEMDSRDNHDLFMNVISPLDDAGITLFSTPGNHDLFFNRWEEYIRTWKTSAYLFKVVTPSDGTDLYISLDSASASLGTDQRAWLGNILSGSKGKYRRIIVFTHTHFFKRDNSQRISGNYNLEEGYDLEKLFSDCGVSLVLTGHDHHYEDTLFKDVRYLTLSSIADKEEDACFYLATSGSENMVLTPIPL